MATGLAICGLKRRCEQANYQILDGRCFRKCDPKFWIWPRGWVSMFSPRGDAANAALDSPSSAGRGQTSVGHSRWGWQFRQVHSGLLTTELLGSFCNPG